MSNFKKKEVLADGVSFGRPKKMRNPIKILESIAFQGKNRNNYDDVFHFLVQKAVELSQKARRPPLRIEKEVEQLVAEVDRCCRKELKWVKI